MVEIIRSEKKYRFFDTKTNEFTNENIFIKISETKDIDGYYLAMTTQKERVLLSKSGKTVYVFSSKDKLNGVCTLLDKIIKKLDILEEIAQNEGAKEFFADKRIKDALLARYEDREKQFLEKAEKTGDPKEVVGCNKINELERNYIKKYFNKAFRMKKIESCPMIKKIEPKSEKTEPVK